MSGTNGRLVVCDRCYAETFCKCTGEGEADGGYTRWNNFEPLPEGWESTGYAIEGVNHLCPKCSAKWEQTKSEFMNRVEA